jgi:GcrA cell cycle regulator
MLFESAELLPSIELSFGRGRWPRGQWNDEKVARLRVLWTEGVLASAIGAEIDMTKNAVLGKVHRLKLESRQVGYTTPRPREVRPNTGGGLKQRLKARLNAPPFVRARMTRIPCAQFDAAIPRERIKSLIDRAENECRWPIGDPGTPGFGFCCAPISADHPTYCPDHHAFSVEKRGRTPSGWVAQPGVTPSFGRVFRG